MTTAAITVTIAADMSARLSITVTGAGAAEVMNVERDTGGTRSPVFGAHPTLALSTVLTDAAVPLNRPSTWVVILADGTETVSAPATPTATRPVLSDPWSGAGTFVVVVEVDDELTMRARVEVLTVEGATQPVAIVDRPTGYYGRLTLLTTAEAEAATVAAMSLTGAPLLLRCVCGLHPDRWLQLTGDLVTTRLVKRPVEVDRLHAWESCFYLPAAPFPTRPAAADTLADLAAFIPGTLQDIADTWATLGGIAATDLAGGL